MTQEGSEGQGQQNSSPAQQGNANADAAIPAAVTAKFDEIFGKADDGTTAEGSIRGGKKQPQKLSLEAQRRATQAKQRKTQQRAEFFGAEASDGDGEEEAGTGDGEESAQNRSQPLKRGTSNGAAKPNGAKPASAQQQSQASEEEGDGQGDEGQQSQQGAADGDDDAPTLNPILRHAARRAGWSPEEADEFYETNPEKAEAYFQKMHDSFNSVSAQFAQLGQQAAPPQGAPAQQPQGQRPQQQSQQQPAQSGDPVEDLISAMYGSKSDQLTKDYNPEFVDEFARKPAKWLHENVVAPMRQMQQFYQQQQVNLVAQEAKNFTKGLEADFANLYGTQQTRSKEQQETLNNVYGQADIIMAGARQRGVSMTVSEALDRAHNIVASKFLEQQTRKRLVAQVQKRSSQLTQRPTQRKPGGVAGNGQPQKSDQKALEALTSRMQELGIGS